MSKQKFRGHYGSKPGEQLGLDRYPDGRIKSELDKIVNESADLLELDGPITTTP